MVDFEAGVDVLPLGLMGEGILEKAVFRPWCLLNPQNTPEDLLQDISNLYWKKQNFKPGKMQCYFDFRELEHVY